MIIAIISLSISNLVFLILSIVTFKDLAEVRIQRDEFKKSYFDCDDRLKEVSEIYFNTCRKLGKNLPKASKQDLIKAAEVYKSAADKYYNRELLKKAEKLLK